MAAVVSDAQRVGDGLEVLGVEAWNNRVISKNSIENPLTTIAAIH
jgi:hypothetical protein